MTLSFRFLYCAVLLILVVRANCSVQSHLAPTTVEKSVEVHGATDEHHDDHDSTPVDPCKGELGQPGWGTTSAECERCVGSNKHCHLCYYPDALRGICVSDSVAECPYGTILKKSNRFTAAPQCEALAANEETEIELTCAGEDLKRDWVSCPKKLAIGKRGPTFFQLAHEVLGNFDNRHYHGSEVEVVFSVSCPLAMRVYDCEQVLQSKKLSLRIRKLLPILDSINDAEKLHSMADFHFTNMIKAYSHIADAVEAVPDDVKLLVIGVGTGGIAAQSHPPFLDKAAEHVKTHMINIGTHDNAVNSGNLKIDFVPSFYPIDPDIYDRFSNDQTVVEAEGGKKVGELVKQLKEAAVSAIHRIATKLGHLKSQGAVCVVMICMGPRFARYPGLVALKVASPVFLVQAYNPDENPAAVAIPLAPHAKLPQDAHSSVPWFTMLHATFFSKNLKSIAPHDLGL